MHVLLHHQTSVSRTGLHPSLADCGVVMSSRFSLVGHVEVTPDSGEGHQLAWLGPRFQIEFDISFDPEWEEDCAVEGFLVSVCAPPSLTDSTTSGQRRPSHEYVRMCCVLPPLQTVQSGVGWEVLWCQLQGHFLYFWNYPEEVAQCKVGWCMHACRWLVLVQH